MRRTAGLLLLLFASALTAQPSIRSYDVRVDVREDAATGTATVVLPAGTTSITVPLASEVKDARLAEAPAGSSMTATPASGQTKLALSLPRGATEARVVIAFRLASAFAVPEAAVGQRRVLPEGNQLFRHQLVNTESATIERYRCTVAFPPALRVQAIREALPKSGNKEAEPRVRLADVDGKSGAALQASSLRQGATASMQLELTPSRRSPWWIAAGLLLSALYLVYFRDLVRAPSGANAQAPRQSGE